jgi:hypothetical protein
MEKQVVFSNIAEQFMANFQGGGQKTTLPNGCTVVAKVIPGHGIEFVQFPPSSSTSEVSEDSRSIFSSSEKEIIVKYFSTTRPSQEHDINEYEQLKNYLTS